MTVEEFRALRRAAEAKMVLPRAWFLPAGSTVLIETYAADRWQR